LNAWRSTRRRNGVVRSDVPSREHPGTPAAQGMMESIGAWLERLGLGQYTRVFEENDIDPEVMPHMTEADLAELGVSMGHRKKIMAAVRAPAGPEAPPPARTSHGGERRQLTVVFCDLVGFTAITEELDPEEAREVVAAYQRCASSVVEALGGHVAQLLGDGLLVYFGHPQAHEDDAERAVRAGLGIVYELARARDAPPFARVPQMAVRIGIHTGMTVVAEMGSAFRRETLAVGGAPNIAARLQAIAAPGSVVISDDTRRLVSGSFELEDLGPKEVKGIREPVRAWAVTGIRDATSRFEAATHAGLSAFVGREEETSHIVGCWELAASGRGQVVLLTGEAGIGKSRIVQEARHRLAADGARALQIQCSPFHRDTPYHPIGQELSRIFGFERDDSAAARRDRIERLVVTELGRPASDAALLESMLDIEVAGRSEILALPPLHRKRETIRAIADLVGAAADREPTLMLFEDAHWSDPTSLEVLDELVARAASTRLLLIVTCRPEFQASWRRLDHVTTRSISRLNADESAALVSRVTGGTSLAPDLATEIVRRADGVPLYIEELTKLLLETDQPKGGKGAHEHSGTRARTAIPVSLRDSLMARLDRVAHVKEIAQIGATIGREFSYEMIRAVSGTSTKALDQALADLLDSGLAVLSRPGLDAVYSFKHSLVQDVAYESLLTSRRQELHRSIVRVLQERSPEVGAARPELLARHLSAAGLVEAAIPYWRAAADLSLSRMAVWEAESQLRQGLDLVLSLPESDERDQLELPFHALLATTHILARGWGATEVEIAYRRANELRQSAASFEDTLWASWGIWVFHHVRGRIDHALEIAEDLARAANDSGGRVGRLVATMMLGQSYHYAGRFEEARAEFGRSRGLYRAQSDRGLINLYSTDLLLAVDVHDAQALWLLGHSDEATILSRRNSEYARSLDHPYSLSWALTWGSVPHLFSGDVGEMLTNVEEGIAIAEEFGFQYTSAIGSMLRGWGRAEAGALEPGVAEMRSGLETFEATGAAIVVSFFKALLAQLLARSGHVSEGLVMLDEAAAQMSEWGEHWMEPEVHRARGLVLAAGLDPERASAEDSLRQALRVAAQQRANGWARRSATALAGFLSGSGRDEEARGVLVDPLSHLGDGFDTPDLAADPEPRLGSEP
jgi:class 3 adenylate cyclase/predicted ATPase